MVEVKVFEEGERKGFVGKSPERCEGAGRCVLSIKKFRI
jgi:hypothetical protein